MRKIEDPLIVVDVDGELVFATGYGSPDETLIQSDNPSLVAAVKAAADAKTVVEFIPHAPKLVSGWESPMGVLAAMLSIKPGRAYVKEAPKEVLEELHSMFNPSGNIY